MSIRNITSNASFWRGFYYFKEGRVLSYKEIEPGIYDGKVRGSGKNIYDVKLNLNKIRSSECSCPAAIGNKRKVCKHKVALYFAINQDEAEEVQKFLDGEQEEYLEYKKEFENYYDKKAMETNQFLDSLSPSQIRTMLFNHLMEHCKDDFNMIHGYHDDEFEDDEMFPYGYDFDDEK